MCTSTRAATNVFFEVDESVEYFINYSIYHKVSGRPLCSQSHIALMVHSGTSVFSNFEIISYGKNRLSKTTKQNVDTLYSHATANTLEES